MNSCKKRILFIVPLLSPVHGFIVMCKSIMDSQLINDHFDCEVKRFTIERFKQNVLYAFSECITTGEGIVSIPLDTFNDEWRMVV